jgi:hypothetical protein
MKTLNLDSLSPEELAALLPQEGEDTFEYLLRMQAQGFNFMDSAGLCLADMSDDERHQLWQANADRMNHGSHYDNNHPLVLGAQ